MEAPNSSYTSQTGLSKCWKTVKSHVGVYTGGKVEVFERDNQSFIACMLHDDVAILDANTGELKRTLQQDVEEEEEKESYVVFAVRPRHNQLVTAGRNLLIRLWDLNTFQCIKTIKAHDSPVLAMDFDPSGTFFATGGSDRSVKVFDIEKGFCTHNFRRHSGIVTLVKFHPDPKRLQLVSCSDDTTVRLWDLYTQKEVACIQDHMSPVTCVSFSNDGYTLLTSGRDKVVNFWDLRKNVLASTTVVHEGIEGIQVLPNTFKCTTTTTTTDSESFHFVTAGDKGILRLWSKTSKGCIEIASTSPESESLHYKALLLNKSNKELVAISSEQNFLMFNDQLKRIRLIIGFNDDILSLKYIPQSDGTPSNQIAVATNSEQIRLLNRETMSCELLSGHTDIVMALAVSPDGKWLVSSSKDRTARLWDVEKRTCIAHCTGHTETINAVGISQKMTNFLAGSAYFVTGSSDKTLKVWSLKALANAYKTTEKPIVLNLMTSIQSMSAVKAHDKDINAIAVSPNDRFIASASQDKLIKIWNAQDLTLVGTCRGHKRGVWSVEFSPVDQCLASASGDKTVKIWSAKDFSCLKTFEGHTASVLSVQFVCAGMQLMSGGADGLIKLWTIKSNECEATFDKHLNKIWTLAIAKDSSEMVSGGADSIIYVWKDFTLEEETKKQMEKKQKILKEQVLLNHLQQNQFLEAIKIAFELNYPNRLLGILKIFLEGPKNQDHDTGKETEIEIEIEKEETKFIQILQELNLNESQLIQLIDWIKEWNTNARNSYICQILLSSLLREISPQQFIKMENFSKTLEALIAYTERHFTRIDRMLQKSYLIDFTLVSMKRLLPTSMTTSSTTSTKKKKKKTKTEEEEKEKEKNTGTNIISHKRIRVN